MSSARTQDAVILVPGIMGSELVDASGEVVWGLRPSLLFRQLLSGNVLARLRLPPGAPDDGIRPSRLLQVPAYLPLLEGVEPYSELARILRQVTFHPDAVLEFPYDWRRSIAYNARLLASRARAHLEAWAERYRALPDSDPARPDPKLTLVCHSMGGLIARYFTEVLDGRDITRRVVTLGTPFAGSLKAVRLISRGDIVPLGAMAGAVRDVARTLPGVYDLLPRYPCVRTPALQPLSDQAAADLGGDAELIESARRTYEALIAAAKDAGSSACPIRPIVGITQPTLASVVVAAGEPVFDERLDTDECRGGDSTVHRDHAYASNSTPVYLPQKHGKLPRMKEAMEHARAVLTEREPGAFQGDGVGVRLPDAARAGQPFEVVVDTRGSHASCRLIDEDSGRQVDRGTPIVRDGQHVATFSVASPGLYRVSVSGGGFTPVEELLLVLE